MSNNQQNINQPKTNQQNAQSAKPTIADPKKELKHPEYSVDKGKNKSNDNEHCMTKGKKA